MRQNSTLEKIDGQMDAASLTCSLQVLYIGIFCFIMSLNDTGHNIRKNRSVIWIDIVSSMPRELYENWRRATI